MENVNGYLQKSLLNRLSIVHGGKTRIIILIIIIIIIIIILFRYLIKLQPLINGNFSIMGYVEITFDVLESTKNVSVHVADIFTKNETVRVC